MCVMACINAALVMIIIILCPIAFLCDTTLEKKCAKAAKQKQKKQFLFL